MKIIAIYAIEEEAIELSIPDAEMRSICSGVGKTHAAFRLAKAIGEERPDLVINYGTVGTLKHRVGDIVVCNRFIDRDIVTSKHRPTNELVSTPIKGMAIFDEVKTYGTCNTGDRFVTKLTDIEGDVFDMEAYSEALVCKEMGIPFVAVKYVTDIIGQNSVALWEDKLSDARKALMQFFKNQQP
ncbi:MAG: nucleosidase [Bacteroidales bacterium]|nr:nucleosidase [Bacteroidales bacterium]